MDARDIARGGERKRLLFFSASLLLLIVAVNLAILPIISKNDKSFLELVSCSFIAGIVFGCPAFLFMAFFKRLRDARYFAVVGIIAISGAVTGGSTYRWLDLSHHPFPWRTPQEIRKDTVRGAIVGFDLGLVGGAVFGAIAVPLVWRSRPLPQSVLEDKGMTGSETDGVPTCSIDATGIQRPPN
jgi:hypothetical protein